MTYVKSAIEDYTQLQADKLAGKETYEELNLFSLLQSLSIAHFNEGVEWEHLRSYSQALSSYELSRDYAVKVVENTSSSQEGGAGASVSESAMY